MQVVPGKHAGGEVAGTEALGRLNGQAAVGCCLAWLNACLGAEVVEYLLTTTEGTGD